MRNSNISESAKRILNNYISKDPFKQYEHCRSLIISLYSYQKNADSKVKEVLQGEIIDLNEIFGTENLDIIMSEYKGVVKYVNEQRKNRSIFSSWEPLEVREEIIDLCTKMYDIPNGSDVFIPFAGEVEFAYDLESCNISGFEINSSRWAFSQIMLDAYGINADINNYDCSLKKGKNYRNVKQFDYIFSFPPVFLDSNNFDIEYSIIEWLNNALKDNGVMFLLMPQSVTSSERWLPFRKNLIENINKYSVCILSLPITFEPVSNMEACLFIIHKRDKDPDTFVLMDARKKEFVRYHDFRAPLGKIKIDSIIDCFNGPDDNYVEIVSANELTGDSDLTPKRYFVDKCVPKPKKGETIYQLNDLIIPQKSKRPLKKQILGKVIGMKELSDEYLNSEIDIDALVESNLKGFSSASIPTGCFAAYMNGKMKIGHITKVCKSEFVFLRWEVIQFVVRPESPVSYEFILKELLSEYVAAQAEKLSIGTTIKRLAKRDFLSLKIVVPSLEEQTKVLREDSKISVLEADLKMKESFMEFRQDMHMKKHAVGQTIFNLNNWIKLLGAARRLGNGIVDDNVVIGTVMKTKVSDIYDNIDNVLKTLSEQIRTFDIGYGMQTTNVPLVDFLHDFIEKNQSPLFRYEFREMDYRAKEDLPDFDIDDTDPDNIKIINNIKQYIIKAGEALDFIEFPEEALSIILQNIIANACHYGFTDDKMKYKVRISIKSHGTDVILVVENNGTPLHEGMTTEDIFRYSFSTGENGHYGIGGYQIRKLMREFDGDVIAISSPDAEYKLAYELTFHKTNIIASFGEDLL